MTFTQKTTTFYTDLSNLNRLMRMRLSISSRTEIQRLLILSCLNIKRKFTTSCTNGFAIRKQQKTSARRSFLKAFNALPNFKGGSAFYSWIYRIAINCSIDFQRQRNRDKVLTFEELPFEADEMLRMTDSHPSPEQLLDEKELGLIIRKAVRKLPPGQRRVFNLRHRRELAIKEIAALLNRSEGTVKAHLHHAHRRLQGMLLPYLRNEPLEWNGEIR